MLPRIHVHSCFRPPCSIRSERLKRLSPDVIVFDRSLWSVEKKWEFILGDARQRNRVIRVFVCRTLFDCLLLKGQKDPAVQGKEKNQDISQPLHITGLLRCLLNLWFSTHTHTHTHLLPDLSDPCTASPTAHQPKLWLCSLNGDKRGFDSLHKPQQISAL